MTMRKLTVQVFFLSAALLLCLYAYPQTHVITGVVADSTGSPVANVSIVLKGAKRGTYTSENGSFRIEARSSDVLIFSGVSFSTQEVRVGNRTALSIMLGKSSQTMSEVVVTALGIRRTRNSLPYATQQVSGDDVTKTLNTNFVDNLSGKVSGMQVTSSNTMGGSTNVILRGMKSLTQTNQALFVVDGMPFDNTNQAQSNYDLGNTASDINPDDIESVSVLKGAAASALYGSRGANGVILITTKKGVKGRGLGVTLDFGMTTGTPDRSTLPQYQQQYGEGAGSAGSSMAGNPNPFFYYEPTFNSNGQNELIVQTDIDQMTGPAYNPGLLVYQWDAFSPGNPNYGKPTPWMPAAHHNPTDYFVTPITTSSSVYADAGDDKGTFKIGFTHSDDKGYIPNSNLSKNLLNFGATRNITDKLTVGGTFNYSDEAAIGRYGYGYGGGNGTQINPMTDFRQFWQTGVNLHEQKDDFFRTLTNATWNWDGGYTTNTTGHIALPAYHDNPYWVRYMNYESDSRARYFGNVYLNYKVAPFLNILGRASMDTYNQLVETRYAVGSEGTPAYSRVNYGFAETNYDLLINFDKNLTNKLNLKALVGSNIRQDNINSLSAATNGGLVVPGLYALNNSVNTPNAPTEVQSEKQVNGIFGGVTLAYMDMITLDATLRRDQSSTLPAAFNKYYYPSISGNFVFSKLLPTANWLSYGKLRANYAAVGNDAQVYSLQNTYSAVTPFNGQTIFAAPATNNNINLKPEINHTYEGGLEMSFFRNRVGFDLTYYNARLIDQILPVSVSTASGYSKFFVNGGTIQNRGFEVTLNLVPVKTRDFTWNMTVNWSDNRNKALSLYDNQPSFEINGYQNSIQLVAEVGKSYGIIRGSDYTYLNGKRVVDATGKYILNANKLSDIGNINPDWIGGVNNSFQYKQFSLGFLIDMRQGGQVYSLDQDYGASAGTTPHTAGNNALGNPVRSPLTAGGGVIFPGVTADGKANVTRVDASDFNKGDYPFSSLFGEAARSYVYDASYIKLRELNLTWSVPRKTLGKMNFVKGIDLSLTGRNLWIIHKNLPDSDPEQGVASSGSYGQNASMGFQSGAYPVFRTYGFNVKVKF
jgi:TonB-linked SusC/RagA family outer membrane protein